MTLNSLNFSQYPLSHSALNINDEHQQNEIVLTISESGRLEPSLMPNSTSCTTEISGSQLIDKVADVAIQNREVGLILAGAVGMAILIYAGGKAIAELIRASHV